MEKDKLILRLKAVADPNRLKIIELLREGSLCACELLEHFSFTQPTLSHHMKILAKAELVVVEKKGQWHHYELKNDEVTIFLDEMTQLFQPLNNRES
ncbi:MULTISPECIES: metalloregulator ArsR/SmtB family transcription factor [Vagococcus]|uniref:ArsR/SmtB family transcription factor n=1 Tax=Vagococcus TaxID=2737 RepID=UPI002FCADBA9